MPDWPLTGDGQRYVVAGTAASTLSTVMSSGSPANTKPATFTTIVASTPIDAQGFLLSFPYNSGNNRQLVDIAVGAASSEQVILSNFMIQTSRAAEVGFFVYLPIPIPAGTRISGRNQSSTTNATMYAHVQLIGGSFVRPSAQGLIRTYGVSATTMLNTDATLIDPGAVIHTKGAWVTLPPAPVTEPIREMFIAIGNRAQAASVNVRWFLDIGIGAAGSEQVIVPDIGLSVNSTSFQFRSAVLGPIPVHIPAGSRISARAQGLSMDINYRTFQVAVYGIS